MRPSRAFFLAASLASTTALALACGGQTSGPGGGGGGSACDRLYDVLEGCSTTPPPADEVARVRARWDALCASVLALPGEAVTSDAIDACVSAVGAQGCSLMNADTGPCSFRGGGTLAAGSTCESDAQCQSSTCSLSPSSDGGLSLCGTCSPSSAIGQPCNGRSCGLEATCTVGTTGSGEVCVANTVSDVGGACDHEAKQCKPGLTCNNVTQTCASPAPDGAACVDDNDCASPLVCIPSPNAGNGRCGSPGQAGAYCEMDSQCAKGLGCDWIAHACGAVSYVAAGQPCTAVVRCLVGGCPLAVTSPGGTDAGASATCPTVIPDGQPCDVRSETSTCDTFANCANGVCTLGYAGICN